MNLKAVCSQALHKTMHATCWRLHKGCSTCELKWNVVRVTANVTVCRLVNGTVITAGEYLQATATSATTCQEHQHCTCWLAPISQRAKCFHPRTLCLHVSQQTCWTLGLFLRQHIAAHNISSGSNENAEMGRKLARTMNSELAMQRSCHNDVCLSTVQLTS